MEQVEFLSFTPSDYINSFEEIYLLSEPYGIDFMSKLLKNIASSDNLEKKTLMELIYQEIDSVVNQNNFLKSDNKLITTKRVIITPSRIIYCFPNSWVPNRAIVSQRLF